MMIRTFKAASFQEACEQVQSMMGPNAFVLKREKKRVPGVIGWLLKRYEWEIVAARMDKGVSRVSGINQNKPLDHAVPIPKRRQAEQSGAFRIPTRRTTLGASRNRSDKNSALASTLARESFVPGNNQSNAIHHGESPLTEAFDANDQMSKPKAPKSKAKGQSSKNVIPIMDEMPIYSTPPVSGSIHQLSPESSRSSLEPSNPELLDIKSQMAEMQSMFKQFMTAQQEKDSKLKELEETVKSTLAVSVPAGDITDEAVRVDKLVQAAGTAGFGSRQMVSTSYSGTPDAVRNIINHLRHAEFEAPLIAAVRGHLFEVMDEHALASESAVRQCVSEFIAKSISVTGGIKLKRGEKGKCVALVGPTGVGKTTTLAKLAAVLKYNFGLDVGFITIDTYRIAACDQLEKYGEIIEVPVHIAFDPKQLQDGLEMYADKDVILIDTVGRNGKNTSEIQEIGRFLDCGRKVETHLVLSACSKFSEMKKDLANFAPLGFEQVIFSKTDESETLGTALSIISEAGKSVSYITTGQNVPVDILVADSANLAMKAVTAPVDSSVEGGSEPFEVAAALAPVTSSAAAKAVAPVTSSAAAKAVAPVPASASEANDLDDMLTMSTVIDASKGAEVDSSVKI